MKKKRPGNPNIREISKGTQFKKGHKPTGHRPKGSISITDALRRTMERDFTQKDPITGNQVTMQVRDWIGIAITGKAMKGDISAIREILDRLEGKTATPVELTGKDGEPIKTEQSICLSAINERLAEFVGVGADSDDSTLSQK